MGTNSTKVKQFKAEYGFSEKKSLGQNFLIDENVIDNIVSAANIGPEDLVIEIGPGMGALTCQLAEEALQVVAIEIDKSLLPILAQSLAAYDNVDIINDDVLKVDINRIIGEYSQKTHFSGVKIIGNLPYYITTPIIMKLLEERVSCDSITVMMQKEVADRIKSGPGTRTYGAISVAVQFYCHVDSVMKVPSSSFSPAPKVDSAVLTLLPRKTDQIEVMNSRIFFECVKKSFGQRRKTLQNSMTGTAGLSKERITEILGKVEIDPGRRAETLSVNEFAALADAVAAEVKEK